MRRCKLIYLCFLVGFSLIFAYAISNAQLAPANNPIQKGNGNFSLGYGYASILYIEMVWNGVLPEGAMAFSAGGDPGGDEPGGGDGGGDPPDGPPTEGSIDIQTPDGTTHSAPFEVEQQEDGTWEFTTINHPFTGHEGGHTAPGTSATMTALVCWDVNEYDFTASHGWGRCQECSGNWLFEYPDHTLVIRYQLKICASGTWYHGPIDSFTM